MRVKKDVVIRIYRKLLGKGAIHVSKGQEVTPEDLIGTSLISPGFWVIKLAEQLSVAPTEVRGYLKRPLGQRIYKGELLAQRSSGMFGRKKIVTAPTDGVLDFLNPKTGELRMIFLPKKQDLPAGVYGIVEYVDQVRGEVIIKTQVNLIQGILGSGRIRDGILKIIGKRDELIGKSFISQKLDGQIIAGGSLALKDAIYSSISEGVSAIITGGINAKDYRAMAGGRLIFPQKVDTDIGITIVVCEGFGPIPIGEDIYDLLREHDGKFISVDGHAGQIYLPSFESGSINKVRATHLPPIQKPPFFDSISEQPPELRPGLKVRVIGPSFTGEQGRIVTLDKTETKMPSGVKAFLATIETARRKIQAPVDNLEIINYSH